MPLHAFSYIKILPFTDICTARPRSCVDSVNGFSVVSDIASTVRKRWSGIHIGSKLANAFEKLAPDDTEEDYTDRYLMNFK